MENQRRHKEEIKIFIPAKALEHHDNPEEATRRDKIINAILRWWQKQDFFSNFEPTDIHPFVDLHVTQFNPDELGYHANADVFYGA